MRDTKIDNIDILRPKGYEVVRDYTPKTSPGVFEDFMKGSIYEDFLNEIAVRIEQMRDINEECASNLYLETRGGIRALRLISDIFENLYNNAKDDINRNEEQNAR